MFGSLPGGPLSRKQLGNLRVYAGTEHPHKAQEPEVIDVAAVAAQAAQTGVRWLIYEQDRFPVSALESARHCLRACRAAGVID